MSCNQPGGTLISRQMSGLEQWVDGGVRWTLTDPVNDFVT